MAVRMRDLGYTQITAAIIVSKLKNLRTEHKTVRDIFIRGTGKVSENVKRDDPKASCPHYHNEILGGKPSVNPPPGLLGQSSQPPRPTKTTKSQLKGVPICVVCGKECGSYKCRVCLKPTHIISPCVGQASSENEEGFGSAVTCELCLDITNVPDVSDDDEDDLPDLFSVPPK
ncbi:uncharacterized protein LOC117120850 [Anneissia japonica]|uniref:uncharacterized protein LOC117120850 n=1 Tax=Anneissia japonica TaxID=1529436 RepID=UPI001425671E|nr:uncharacterized protein LOC117120850 [Anneissia japonica]